jgi:hypothetical protein
LDNCWHDRFDIPGIEYAALRMAELRKLLP